MPVPLVVFSGGLDSTFLLYKTLLDGNVETCYFDAGQHKSKVKAEMLARANIVPILECITGHRVLNDTVVKFSPDGVKVKPHYSKEYQVDFGRENVPNGSWGQAYLWMFGLLKVTDPQLHTKVRMGYVMGDEISMHLDNIKQAWRYLQSFTKQTTLDLEFPLSTTLKERIIQNMPHDVMKHIWHCELPIVELWTAEGTTDVTASKLVEIIPDKVEEDDSVARKYLPCGECVPCRTKMKYVFMWEHDHKYHATKGNTTFDEYFSKDLPVTDGDLVVTYPPIVNKPDGINQSGIQNDTLKGEIFTLNETRLEAVADFNYADMFRIYDEQNDLTRQQGVVAYLINNGFAIDITMGKGSST